MCCKYVIGINGTEDFSAGTWRGGGRREHLRCDREIRDDKIGDIDIGDIVRLVIVRLVILRLVIY